MCSSDLTNIGVFFFFKQKTAYALGTGDWSSDVCLPISCLSCSWHAIDGTKRIILVDGEPVGAINRVPAAGETRSNMHVGGRPEKIDLTDRDREICARIGPLLKEKGQIFVGIDVIGEWLTEINVTSPTGIQELERFDGVNIAEKIWTAIEALR